MPAPRRCIHWLETIDGVKIRDGRRTQDEGPLLRKLGSTNMANIKVLAVLVALPGKTDELRKLLEGLLEPSRAEIGNLRYDLWADYADPSRFFLDELYVGQDAVEFHRATPHFKDYLARIADLAERTAWTLKAVGVVADEA